MTAPKRDERKGSDMSLAESLRHDADILRANSSVTMAKRLDAAAEEVRRLLVVVKVAMELTDQFEEEHNCSYDGTNICDGCLKLTAARQAISAITTKQSGRKG